MGSWHQNTVPRGAGSLAGATPGGGAPPGGRLTVPPRSTLRTQPTDVSEHFLEVPQERDARGCHSGGCMNHQELGSLKAPPNTLTAT